MRILLFLLGLVAASTGHAFDSDRFTDPADGQFDLSKHLLEHKGFFPVPIIITEPALGFGGGLGVMYFDQSIQERNQPSPDGTAAPHFSPPNISGVGGFKTENGSWGVGGGLFRSFDNDNWRYLGILGKAELALDFYGPLGNGSAYDLSARTLVQQLSRRVGSSNWLLGARYVYVDSTVSFKAALPGPLAPDELDQQIGRLGFLVNYDSRDNILSPASGQFLELEAAMSREWLGSDKAFQDYKARWLSYHPIGKAFNLGLRFEFNATDGNAPFFALPFVSLRGVPAMRYQDERTALTEMELRWQFSRRWSVLGFAGVGKAYGRFNDFSDADTVVNRGLGVRYLIASKLGLHAGIDVARGPEDTAAYIQIGSAWR